MNRIPGRGWHDVLGRDQVEAPVLRFVDQHFGMLDVDVPIEQRGFRKVNPHRSQFRSAHAAAILHVPSRDRVIHISKAFGGLTDGFGKRTPDDGVARVLLGLGSHDADRTGG